MPIENVNTLSEIKAVMYDPEKKLNEVFGSGTEHEYEEALNAMCGLMAAKLQECLITGGNDLELAIDLLENTIGIHSYTGRQLYQFTLLLQSLLKPVALIGQAQFAHMKECAVG